MSKRSNKKNKWVFAILGIFLVIVGVWRAVDLYLPNFEVVPAYKLMPQLTTHEIGLVLKDDPIQMEYPPKVIDGEILLPIDFVQQYIDPYLFWDENDKQLTITTENKVIRMKTDDLEYYVNHEPLRLHMPVQKMEEGIAYLPISAFTDLYQIKVIYHTESQIIVIDDTTEKQTIGKIQAEKADVRFEPNIKSPIVEKVGVGEELVIYAVEEQWLRVRTSSGTIGYVWEKNIGELKEIVPEKEERIDSPSPWRPETGRLNLVWDQVFNPQQSQTASRFEPVKGLDVVSPTWFSIANEEGDISNIADKRYVDWAHSNGYQVWALFDNQFNGRLTHTVLSSTELREKMIKQILAFVALYQLDGINIDFESVLQETGIYYVQFIREITPLLKEQGVVVSVDMYVPSSWTAHYNRTEVGKIVDYVMVMAYDEHWGTSPKSGSVASIGWVEEGIRKTLEEVPAEKVVMGLPYYTRLWQETTKDGKTEVSAKAYGMKTAREMLESNGAEIIWLEEEGQYYGEYVIDGITYKCWLEEERSIEEKVKLVDKYNLAGVAGWKKGLEKPDIWDILHKHLKN